jgi:hypothetical protein
MICAACSTNHALLCSMKTRHFLLIIGFLLFVLGMLSLVLILIGANLTILDWIDKPGTPRGIIIRLMMIGGGLVLAYTALNPPRNEEDMPKSDQ